MTCHENNCWEKLEAELMPCSVGVSPPTRGNTGPHRTQGHKQDKCQSDSTVRNTRKTNVSVCVRRRLLGLGLEPAHLNTSLPSRRISLFKLIFHLLPLWAWKVLGRWEKAVNPKSKLLALTKTRHMQRPGEMLE